MYGGKVIFLWFAAQRSQGIRDERKNISLWTSESLERKSLISKGSPTPLHLLLGLISALWILSTLCCPECPCSLAHPVPTGRFLSWLTLRAPHCVSCTVIHGRVLSSQAVNLQVQRVLAVVSGDGESALHRVCIACATSIPANTCDPLQSLPWSLADPFHVVVAEGESRGCTGESQGTPRLHQVTPRLHQLHLTLDTCRRKTSCSGNYHISCFSLTHIHSHTQFFFSP